ncbi:Rhodanese-like domain-containing protein [Hypoxylon argillaceum]|nr:Rhodanese-like domain-containing protein [Hypoxylon argillaceum]
MATIPTRRLLTTGALTARPCLRARAPSTAAVTPSLRATFSSSGRHAASRTGVPRACQQGSRPRQPCRQPLGYGVRWSTTSAKESKIFTFEEIQTLSSAPSTPTKPLLIDVREPAELQQTGRIPGAVNVPITTNPDSFHIAAPEFARRFGFPRPPRHHPVVFYCKAGVRSRAAAGLAREAGWEDVGEYPGSWREWAAKGGDVEQGAPEE